MLDATKQKSAAGVEGLRKEVEELTKQSEDKDAVIRDLRVEVARSRSGTPAAAGTFSSLRTDTQISSMSPTVRSFSGAGTPASFAGSLSPGSLESELEVEALRRRLRAQQQKNAGLKSRLASLEMGIQQVDVLKQRNMDLFDRISDLKTRKKHDRLER